MRVAVIGGTGTIGKAVVEALGDDYEVLRVGRTSGDYQADITSPDSVHRLFDQMGEVGAVIVCAGGGAWKPLVELTDEDFAFSLGSKLMGQVNVVRYGMEHMREGGSFTLTSGILARYPTPGSAAITLINSGVEAFARAAALEMPRGIRVNVVSPPWVSETLEKMGRDTSEGLSAETVAKAYLMSLEGDANGAVIDAQMFA